MQKHARVEQKKMNIKYSECGQTVYSMRSLMKHKEEEHGNQNYLKGHVTRAQNKFELWCERRMHENTKTTVKSNMKK